MTVQVGLGKREGYKAKLRCSLNWPGIDRDSPSPRAPTRPPLHPILCLRLPRRLPLHVARGVGTAAGERHDVIHDVTRPAVRVPAPPHEIVLRRLAAMNAT